MFVLNGVLFVVGNIKKKSNLFCELDYCFDIFGFLEVDMGIFIVDVGLKNVG